MHLGFHGGLCCGIKVIHGLSYYPNSNLPALDAIEEDNKDAYGLHVSSSERFFHEAAPVETYTERLDRYIDYCQRRRPKGIIEITLATDPDGNYGQEVWFPLLRSRGFKRVNKCLNSNSGNLVHVFHKNCGGEKKGKE